MLQIALLAELNDCQFHSGQRLAEKLGVTRAAVWKSLKQLQEQFDLEIHAVSGKGYRLSAPIELLDRTYIQSTLAKTFKGWQVETFFSIDSTNQYLLDKAAQSDANHWIVFAEHQKTGRGRRGRHWVSPFGANLYCSLLYRIKQSAHGLMGLSLAVAVAVSRTLREVAGIEVQVKWPNDILYQNKKLCGILLELHGEHTGPTAIVVGIGVNMRLSEQNRKMIDQASTTIEEICEQTVSRNELAANLVKQVIAVMLDFEQRGLANLLVEWKKHDAFIDRPVSVQLGNKNIAGVCRGVDEHGALLVETDGQVQRYFSGEITLRAG